MIFLYFSQERAATNLRTGRQVRTARPGLARSPCFSLYIYARFHLRTNSIHHLKTLDYGRTTGQQPAVDGHPARHGRERHAPSRQRSKGRRVTDQEPAGGQQRPPAGGSPRRYVFEFLFQPLEPVERPDPLPLLPCAGRGGAAGSRRFPATGEPVRQDGRAARCAVRGAAARAGAAADPSRAAATAGGCAAAVRRADRTEPAVQVPPGGHRLEQPRRPRRAAGADRGQRDARPDAPGLPDRQDRPGAFPLRRHLAQQRQPALAQARHGRQADRVQPRHPRPGEDAEAVLRLRHHRLRQAGAPADGQHGASGDCHQPGGRAGRSPCQPQPQDQRAGRLPALQGQYPGGEERAYLHPGRDSPAQTGRGGGLPVPFQSQGGGAAQALPGTRAVQRSQDAARISLRRPGQAGDGCVQGEPETDRQSGGTEDLPQAGAYREVPPRTRSRGNGQGLRLGGQERKSLPRLHHMEARREARLHVPQGLQGGARRGACQARRGERGAGGGQFRGQDRRGDPQPERSPAIRTAATHRGAETAAGAQAGAERGPETGTEAGTARQAQAQPGCPSMISPAIL